MKRLLSGLLSSSLLAASITVGTSLVAPNTAQAFSLYIDPQYGSTENTGATARLNYNFVQQGNNVLLDIGITNTTNGLAGLGATESTLVGIALDLVDGLTYRYNAGSSSFMDTYTNVSIPGLTNHIFDYGIRSTGTPPGSGNFIGGNPQQGLKAGQTSFVGFLISGSNLVASNIEQQFLAGYQSGVMKVAGRFQEVNAGGGSDKVLGGIDQIVPEPSSLLGLGLLGTLLLTTSHRQNKRF